MSYESARKLEIHDAHQRQIEFFANAYRAGQPTIVLIPGGMGSHLDRSTDPYRGDASIPFGRYDPVWMDLEIFLGRDAELIAIQENDHDAGEHLIIPNGPLRFFVNAYNGTEKFFRELGWNYIVFGFDWRRPLAEGAAQLEEFLTNLRDRVKDLRDTDPLPTTTLLAHSQGGLVGKIFLHRVCGQDGAGLAKWCARLVTVATPFYGTANHQHRYYVGQSPLNLFYGERRIAEVSSSLPGPYILMTADRGTLNDAVLGQLGLSGYPMVDADSGEPADPYDPTNLGRFPPWVSRAQIAEALLLRETIAAPLPARAAGRLFHIRSGRNKKTGVRLRWKAIDGATFKTEDGSPVREIPGTAADNSGPNRWGDGTVPYWSARLAQIPESQVFDLRTAQDHGYLCEHAETLKVIEYLVNEEELPEAVQVKAPDATLGVVPASRAATRRFLADAHSGRLKKSDARTNDPALWRGVLNELSLC